MAFDGMFLRQIVKQLQPLQGARINKIYQISDTEILFILKGHVKYQLMISCHSSYNRIHLTDHQYPTRTTPSNYIMVLRKHLEGGTVLSIEQVSLDRYLIINVANRNEIGDRITLQLYVELMGKYANLILVNEGRILEALKHIPPYENTRRIIHPGAMFKPTDSQDEKVDPYSLDDVSSGENLFEKLIGFSPLLSNEFQYRMNNGQSYRDILAQVDRSESIFISKVKGEEIFHCIPLTHLQVPATEMEICAGLDYIYFAKEERERIRQQTGDLFKFTRREIRKCENKLDKLNASLEEALNCDIWRQYGDALYANSSAVTKGKSEITLQDYEGNSLTVPLDPKLDLKGNARKCFQKYRKGTNGQKYISEQIQQTEDNLAYFQALQIQLEQADFLTAGEIRQELEDNGYLRGRKTVRKKKKVSEPSYTKLPYGDHIIYIGRNNIQNDFVTFKKAARNDTWFHVKDMTGAHVVITTPEPSEEEIRLCAQIAAYYSRARKSSSVPVNYTQIRQLKKIPGSKLGLVSMKQYNTIYIDVDEEYIEKILENR